MGLQRLAEEDRQTCSKLVRSKLWAIGCSLFITSSIVNFLALTLAPASILVPLEAVQFICNVAFGKFVRKLVIPWRMYGGVGLMCFGVFLAVFFGERGSFCFTEDDLKEKWTFEHGWGWWIYIAITFSFSVVCILAHRKCWAMRKAGKPYPNAQLIMPVLYAVPSSLLGGGQMIVQSKVLSEMLEISIQGPNEYHIDYVIPLAGWFFWVTLLLVSVMGMFWFFRLTQSLGLYEPLFIIPLMQASFIVFGGIAVSSQQIRRGTPPAAAAAHAAFFIYRDTPSPPFLPALPYTHFCTDRLSPALYPPFSASRAASSSTSSNPSTRRPPPARGDGSSISAAWARSSSASIWCARRSRCTKVTPRTRTRCSRCRERRSRRSSPRLRSCLRVKGERSSIRAKPHGRRMATSRLPPQCSRMATAQMDRTARAPRRRLSSSK